MYVSACVGSNNLDFLSIVASMSCERERGSDGHCARRSHPLQPLPRFRVALLKQPTDPFPDFGPTFPRRPLPVQRKRVGHEATLSPKVTMWCRPAPTQLPGSSAHLLGNTLSWLLSRQPKSLHHQGQSHVRSCGMGKYIWEPTQGGARASQASSGNHFHQRSSLSESDFLKQSSSVQR